LSVRLRLRRMGRKKRPYYRIVAADQRSPRDGRFIEIVGNYDPLQKPYQLDIKEDRVHYWLDNGAQPSTTVKRLFRRQGIWFRRELLKKGIDQEKIDEEIKKWELLQIVRQKSQEVNKIKKAKGKAEKKQTEKEESSATAAPAKPEESQVEETVASTDEQDKIIPTPQESEVTGESESVDVTEEVEVAADDKTEDPSAEVPEEAAVDVEKGKSEAVGQKEEVIIEADNTEQESVEEKIESDDKPKEGKKKSAEPKDESGDAATETVVDEAETESRDEK
jgi:small subunit ribosomal protein S16